MLSFRKRDPDDDFSYGLYEYKLSSLESLKHECKLKRKSSMRIEMESIFYSYYKIEWHALFKLVIVFAEIIAISIS